MRSLIVATLALGLTVQADIAAAQPARAAAVPAPQVDMRPIVIGLGAIAGVVAFNVLALGIEALPGGLAYGAGTTVPAEMSVAISRVYATTAAVIGGWVAYYSYGQ
jgi:hypothetical protein